MAIRAGRLGLGRFFSGRGFVLSFLLDLFLGSLLFSFFGVYIFFDVYVWPLLIECGSFFPFFSTKFFHFEGL